MGVLSVFGLFKSFIISLFDLDLSSTGLLSSPQSFSLAFLNLPFINLNGDFIFGNVILGIPIFGICIFGFSILGVFTFTAPVKLPETPPDRPPVTPPDKPVTPPDKPVTPPETPPDRPPVTPPDKPATPPDKPATPPDILPETPPETPPDILPETSGIFGRSTCGILGIFILGTSGIRFVIFNSIPNCIELPNIEKSIIAVPSKINSKLPASIGDISST